MQTNTVSAPVRGAVVDSSTFAFLANLNGQVGVQEVLWWIESRFAAIAGVRTSDGSVVVLKSILPDELLSLSTAERLERAVSFNTLTDQYHRVLLEYGVTLAHPYTMLTTEDGWSVHVTPFVGVDYEEQIRSDPSLAPFLLREIVRCVNGVLHQKPPFRVGLDLRLSNFAGYPDRTTCYFDTFPPLFWDGQMYHVFIPQPETEAEIREHIARKFDPCGSLRRMRFELLSIDPQMEAVLMEVLQNELSAEQYVEIATFFAGLPDRRITGSMSTEDLITAIRDTDPHDIDSLREIGARRVPMLPDRRELMERIFYVTRYPDPEGRRIETDPTLRHDRLIEILCSL